MNKRFYLRPLIFLPLFTALVLTSFAQSPGLIVRPAGGPYSTVLNPNQNGFSSSSVSGFTTNDISESEIVYHVVPPAITEPTGDLATGPSGGFTDIVKTVDNSGFYVYSNGTNIYFRLRIGGIISGSKGYSILIDTDGKMGNIGAYADPNYVAPTNSSNGNPGFEYEVVFQTNFRIDVYNVNGTGNPVSSANFPLSTHSQISVALSRDGNNPDYFYDWYVPLSALGSPSSIRMAATTVTSPNSALQGSRSDIYGIDDASSSVDKAWETVVNAQPFINITGSGITSVGSVCTSAPTLNAPISAGSSVSVSGTWTSMDATKPSTATITLYKNSAAVNTTTVTSGNTWNITVPVIADGDILYAKAIATGESECLQSSSVLASACPTLPAAPVITCASQKGITGNIPLNSTILLYQVTTANTNPTTTLISTNISYPTTTTFAYHNNNCGGSGSPLTAGVTYLLKTVSASGCVSGSTLICIQGSSSVNTMPANTISITTPVYPFQNSISGTNATTGELLRLFINDMYISSQTASGATFTFSGLTLQANDQIKIYSQASTCMTVSSTFTVNCYNAPPVITTDVNGKLVAGATSVSGRSVANASITLNRTSPTAGSWTTTASASGNWTITGLSLAANETYTATVTATPGCATAGQASPAASVVNATTVCPTISGTYTDVNTSVTGSITTSATGTVRLYLDDVLLGSFAVTTTGTSAWTISPLTYPLYNGGVLRASFQAGTNSENGSCGTSTVSCTSPATPSITPVSSTIYTGQTVNYSVSNVANNTWYAVMDNSSVSYATSVYTNSTSGFSLTTKPFSTAGTYNVRLSADKLSGCPSSYATATIVVNLMALPATFKKIDAKRNDNDVLISWDVANESAVLHYVVERSYNCRDFTAIATVPYKSTGSAANHYAVTDPSQSVSTICYRIKQVGENRNYSYSSIATVSVSQQASLSIWPNPATSQVLVNVNVSKSVQAKLELIDANGRVVLMRNVNLRPDAGTFILGNLQSLHRGSYILKISGDKNIFHHKLLLK